VNTRFASYLVGLALFFSAADALAQMPGYASGSLFSRVDGEQVRVAVVLKIDDGWHLYGEEVGGPGATGQPTQVSLGGEGIAWSKVWYPPAHKRDQLGLDSWAWEYEGTLVLYALGELSEGAAGTDVVAEVDGLTCHVDGTCVLYGETLTTQGAGPDKWFADFPVDLGPVSLGAQTLGAQTLGAQTIGAQTIGAEGMGSAVDYDAVVFPEFMPQTEAVSRGLGAWLLLAFLAGMILNVMPCVLPVISIKILSFVQQAGEDKSRVLHLGLAFAGGIVVVFLALAALAVNLKLGWGEQFQSQQFLVVMIAVVFAFSLSMFGVFDLGVPAGVGGLASGPPREGLGDAFFKGMLATVLATPCSGPFLGSTLTWTLLQPPIIVFSVFLSLGLGMALPYVVLTANPALLRLVPKPGPWMDTFKHAMGFVLLLTVVYLMVSLRQDLMLFTVAFLLFVGIGCWWWGRFSRRVQSKSRRMITLAVALLVVALGARLSFVDFRSLFLPSGDGYGWVDFEPDLFTDALEDGRSVFVDFTADWCPNCKANEKLVYESEEALSLFEQKDVLMLKADITRNSPKTSMLVRLRNELGSMSIPFMAVFSGENPGEPQVRHSLVGKQDFLQILESLPETGS